MANAFAELKTKLAASPKTWLVTGAAGFIGSHLTEHLLRLGQRVVGFDNFATGHRRNLDAVEKEVGAESWAGFRLFEGDLRDLDACRRACDSIDYVLHQAALGSVPRSIADPITTHAVNLDGFVNMLVAARDAKVKRFVYASSSSIYGDEPNLPKREDRVGNLLSPYALTKWANELYAAMFARSYGMECAGLRYFNVFGARQDPEGQYAAVIPKWTAALIKGESVRINGKGEISRDFCYVENVVQANLLAATAPDAPGHAFNVALNDRTDLNQLFEMLRVRLLPHFPRLEGVRPVYGDYRPGDIMHSQADISLAQKLLGYAPTHTVDQGMDIAMDWYRTNLS